MRTNGAGEAGAADHMTARAYYNEHEPYAAAWLRNLIAEGHIAPGEVDERSIEDVNPSDLVGFTQCHFFAGIGGWSRALRLAGWPDDRRVWTGSCPCQPFSTAGKGGGFADERHLWPAWHYLIQERGPAVVFGEQVASGAAGEWLDLVQDDLEGMGYAFGAVPFPAAGLGAPHIRDRLYWVADVHGSGCAQGCEGLATTRHGASAGADRCAERLANTQRCKSSESTWQRNGSGEASGTGEADRATGRREVLGSPPAGPLHGFWADADWLLCRDGKWRPVEPGTFPLAHGVAGRVGRLRAYGNAIVAPQAEAFIDAYLTR